MKIDPYLTIFGGTGDLTFRKLLPALYTMFVSGKLPEAGRIPVSYTHLDVYKRQTTSSALALVRL